MANRETRRSQQSATKKKAAPRKTVAKKAATPKKISTAADFKKSASIDLTVPSGQTCRARRVGLEVFVQRGMVPNSLLPMVMSALDEAKPPEPSELKSILKDDGSLADMFDLYDAVTCFCVLEPKVNPVRVTAEMVATGSAPEGLIEGDFIQESDRDSDLLYVDEIDPEDKMFIYQWAVGGTADVERFRDEQGSMLAAVARSTDLV